MQRQHLLAVALLAALLGALLAPAAALAWGEVRAAKSDLNVRAKRSPTAEIVTSLKAGDKIRVDFREGDWVAVFPLDQQARDLTKAVGFVNAKYLGGPLPDPAAQPKPEAKPAAAPAPAAPAKPAAPAAKAEAKPAPAVQAKVEAAPATPVKPAAPAAAAPIPPVPAVPADAPTVQAKVVPAPAAPTAQPAKPAAPAAKPAAPAAPAKPAPQPAAAPEPAAQPAAPAAPGVVESVTAKVEQKPSDLPPPAPAQQPVRITADRLVYNEGQGTVVFEGNVQADHAGMHLQSTKVTAHLNDQGQSKNDGDQIDRIVAEGSVVVTKDTARGTCAMLTYFVQDGVLRMEGDPVLQDGPNTVTGEIIKFYLKDNRSEILSGGGKRVEAVFTLPEEMQVR